MPTPAVTTCRYLVDNCYKARQTNGCSCAPDLVFFSIVYMYSGYKDWPAQSAQIILILEIAHEAIHQAGLAIALPVLCTLPFLFTDENHTKRMMVLFCFPDRLF